MRKEIGGREGHGTANVDVITGGIDAGGQKDVPFISQFGDLQRPKNLPLFGGML
jgi:hypothetical protein